MNPTIGRWDAHRLPRSARVNQTVTRPPHSRHVRQRGNGPRTSGRRGASGHAREAPVMPPERQRGQDEAASGAEPGGARDAPAASGTARQRAHRRTRRVCARDPGQRAFSQGRGQSARRAWRQRPADQPRPAPQVRGRRSVSPPPSQRRDVERNRGGKAGGCAESSVVEGLAFSGQFRCALRSMTGAWHRKWPISPWFTRNHGLWLRKP